MRLKDIVKVIPLLVLLSGPTAAFGKIEVLACEPEWHALVQQIAGDRVTSFSATTAWQDPHYIEAKPSLVAKARRADLIFCTGADLEIGWLPLLIRQSGNSKIKPGQPGYLLAADWVEKIDVPDQIDRRLGDIHGAGNPHVHLNPNNLLIIAEELTARLMLIDAQNSNFYTQQLTSFQHQWQKQMDQWQKMAEPLRGKKVVVHHRSLDYLFQWLGMTTVADLEPKPGLPPTSGHLASLLTVVQQEKPHFIVIAAYQNHKGARWLAKRTHLPIVTLPFTVGGDAKSDTLFSLFPRSINLLLSAGKKDG